MPALLLFGLGASQPQARAVAATLGLAPGRHEERDFEDGEHKTRPLQSVRGADAYVLHSLHDDAESSPNDKLCRLLFFLAALRDHGAARVTAVLPYLCYARKDRRTKPFDPITLRYVAQLFEAVGVDGVLVLDVHNPAAFENAFRCRTEVLEARPLLVARLAQWLGAQEATVLSPDAGGLKRADAFRQALAQALGRPVELGLMEKRRSAGVVSGSALFADVGGRDVVIVDDLIGTGTTLLRTAAAARAAGARRVFAAASHGLFVGAAPQVLADPSLDRILVTDSVPPFRLCGSAAAARVEVLASATLFAQAIARRHGLPASPDEVAAESGDRPG
ncbi:ribose-phosphate diphosphokinase [Cognatiluteimonas weifangensis]|uniref:ribose-phosphate diphosphokinase n=1 Tax=Cognatiluteimonas weifangensis TaxID=2303539 RepID=A0A372DNQ5_9GAMM|nr:ribose-phosphate diphosphokinase [Luteimonas weifangensis]RFP61205.1 ribose-phosphate pyrophosphokinase [Luteimonas weifangensis]